MTDDELIAFMDSTDWFSLSSLRALAAAAYREGFQNAECQNDGFVGVSGWLEANPYV